MRALLSLLGFALRYWLSRSFRETVDLEWALEEEGEDGPTVRRLRQARHNNPAPGAARPVPGDLP